MEVEGEMGKYRATLALLTGSHYGIYRVMKVAKAWKWVDFTLSTFTEKMAMEEGFMNLQVELSNNILASYPGHSFLQTVSV